MACISSITHTYACNTDLLINNVNSCHSTQIGPALGFFVIAIGRYYYHSNYQSDTTKTIKTDGFDINDDDDDVLSPLHHSRILYFRLSPRASHNI